MNNISRLIAIAMIFALGVGTAAVAGSTPDPVMGTWNLDLAKSKFTPGPAPKSQTRTYAETADGIALTYSGVATDGSSISGKSTFKYDGKDYAITGSPDFDTLSLKRLKGNTIRSVQKKNGKVIGSTVRKISADGKVLTLTSNGKDAKGAGYHNVMVFDKQ